MSRIAAALTIVLLAGGCAKDRVTLFENEAGHATGSVAVLAANGGETVLDKANSRAALRDGPTKVKSVKEIKPAYVALFGALPPPVKRFVITFDTDESTIPEGQRGILEKIRNELSLRPGAQIEVAGFTDSTDDEAHNDALSLMRAKAVAQQLRDFGFTVDPDDAVGRGEDEARAMLGDNVADRSYRKVEVIIR